MDAKAVEVGDVVRVASRDVDNIVGTDDMEVVIGQVVGKWHEGRVLRLRILEVVYDPWMNDHGELVVGGLWYYQTEDCELVTNYEPR